MRPASWVLDLLVIAPLLLAGRATDPPSLQLALATLLAVACIHAGAQLLGAWRARREAVLLGSAALAFALGLAVAGRVSLAAPPLTSHGPGSVPVLDWCLALVALAVLDELLLAHVAVLDVLVAAARLALRPMAGSAALQLDPLVGLIALAAALGLYLAFAQRRLMLAARPARADDLAAADSLAVFEWGVDLGCAAIVLAWLALALAPDTRAAIGSLDLVWTAPLLGWIAWRHRGHVRRGSVPRADGKRRSSTDPVLLLLADRMGLAALLVLLAAVLQVIYRPF